MCSTVSWKLGNQIEILEDSSFITQIFMLVLIDSLRNFCLTFDGQRGRGCEFLTHFLPRAKCKQLFSKIETHKKIKTKKQSFHEFAKGAFVKCLDHDRHPQTRLDRQDIKGVKSRQNDPETRAEKDHP